jgi:hypothetical protein
VSLPRYLPWTYLKAIAAAERGNAEPLAALFENPERRPLLQRDWKALARLIRKLNRTDRPGRRAGSSAVIASLDDAEATILREATRRLRAIKAQRDGRRNVKGLPASIVTEEKQRLIDEGHPEAERASVAAIVKRYNGGKHNPNQSPQ